MDLDFDLISQWYLGLETHERAVWIGFPLVVILFRRWFANGLIALLSAALTRFGVATSPDFRAHVRPAMAGLLVAVSVYATVAAVNFQNGLRITVLTILQCVIIFCVFWLINQSAQMLIDQGRRLGVDEEYLHSAWTKQIIKFTLIILMLVVILKAWGVEVGAALTGLGIAGAAVALAGQDFIQNVIAGFNNAGERRFRPGDWVRVDGKLEGVIEDINLRSTTVRQFDNGLVHVPNAVFANSAMINYSRRDARRIYWTVNLRHDTGADALEDICTGIRRYLLTSDLFVTEEGGSPFVQLYEIEDARISLLIYCFAATETYTGELAARHALLLEIKRIVEASGSDFAAPMSDVTLRQDPSAAV